MPPELHTVGAEIIGRQIGEIVGGAREISLVGEVVNGEAGARSRSPAFAPFLVENQQRHEAGLPVVDVNNLRPPFEVTGEMRDALGEEDESLRVVLVVAIVLVVEAGAIEEARAVDEVNGQPGAGFERPHLRLHALAAEREVEVVVEPFQVGKFLADAAIERRDEADLVALLPERLGQRADHVGQPAALGVRMRLAAGEQESHAFLPLGVARIRG